MSAVPFNVFFNISAANLFDKIGDRPVHATNGTYIYPAEKIVPEMLGGFQFVKDNAAEERDVFLVAVNSNKSMEALIDAKQASGELREMMMVDQEARALKVAAPLALQNGARPVVVTFYDEMTPNAMYEQMRDTGVNLASLHKWNYGTDPKAGKIEAAELFGQIYAFPSPADIKPVCDELTRRQDQTGIIQIKKLAEVFGKHGAPYISNEGKILFPAKHDSIKGYTAQPA